MAPTAPMSLAVTGSSLKVKATNKRPSRSRRVVRILGQTENRHHLRGRRDVESGLTGNTLQLASQTHHDVAECPIVEIDHTPPKNASGIDPQGFLW